MNTAAQISLGLALLVSWATPARAHQHAVYRCARYLLTMRDTHFTPSISEEHTRAAMASLHQFRAQSLIGRDYTPGGDAVSADHRSGGRRKNALARRLSGILEESRAQIDVDDAGRAHRQILRASVFEGEAEISRVLDLMAEAGRPTGEARVRWAQSQLKVYVAMPYLAAGIIFLPAALAVALPYDFSNLIFWALAYANRNLPESAVRGLGTFTWVPAPEGRLRTQLSRLGPNAWHASAFDLQLPDEIARRVWATGEVSDAHVAIFDNWKDYPRLTMAMTGRTFLNMPPLHDMQSVATTWLRADSILRWDPASGEPQLILITRLSEEVPPYPQPAAAPRDAWWALPDLSGSTR